MQKLAPSCHLPLILVMKQAQSADDEAERWFRLKRYPHIGLPLEWRDEKWLRSYVEDKSTVTKHAFLPFVHRKLQVRKFRREICHDGTRSELRKPTTKSRDIYFSNHLDSNIFSYYARVLSASYENKVGHSDISSCITAYRRIPADPPDTSGRNKCNIDFAEDVFRYIKMQQGVNLVAITLDIEAFFDSLDHKLLKKAWVKLIDSGTDLPSDHYNVFRNITKFSYINEDELFKHLRDQIIVARRRGGTKRLAIKKKRYMRNKDAVAYCLPKDIHELRRQGLIKSNKRVRSGGTYDVRLRGIPQGSPISAVLANVYMMDFDKLVYEKMLSIRGLYRRYSDDIVAICPIQYENEVIEYLERCISDIGLKLQKSKSRVFHFLFDALGDRHVCYEKNVLTKRLHTRTRFEYLGFQFDGKYALIRNSSMAGYYRRMKRAFARSRFYARHSRTGTKGEIFKARLYKRFTHVGSTRRRIYKRHHSLSNKFVLSHCYDWGNFLTYAKMAQKTITDNKISGQLKRHWSIFQRLMQKM